MFSAEKSHLKRLRKKIDFLFQELILPRLDVIKGLADSKKIDNKKIKQLIVDLSFSLKQTGLPVVNRYNDGFMDTPEFYMLGFVRDQVGADSAITITRIERNRPAISILLFPLKSLVYSVIEGKRAHETKLSKASITGKQYVDEETQVEKFLDDDVFLRVITNNRTSNLKTDAYVTDMMNNYRGAVRFVEMETPSNLLGIAKNKADIFVHLKPVWAWELAAFDHLIHSCGYLVTGTDGILPIEYTAGNLRIAGYIAKNNFEYDTLDFNTD